MDLALGLISKIAMPKETTLIHVSIDNEKHHLTFHLVSEASLAGYSANRISYC